MLSCTWVMMDKDSFGVCVWTSLPPYQNMYDGFLPPWSQKPFREGCVAVVVLQLRAGENMVWPHTMFFPRTSPSYELHSRCMGESMGRATWIWAVILGRVSYGNALVALLHHLRCSYICSPTGYLCKKIRGEQETNMLYLKLCKDPC